jgi:hypothetical protein
MQHNCRDSSARELYMSFLWIEMLLSFCTNKLTLDTRPVLETDYTLKEKSQFENSQEQLIYLHDIF